MRVLIWFHRDLRTHDHAGLNWALGEGHEVFAAAFSPSGRSSSAKLKFWRQTVFDLQSRLETSGIKLFSSDSSAEVELPKLVAAHAIKKIVTHRRMNARDQHEVESLKAALAIDIELIGDTTLFSSEHAFGGDSGLNLNLLKPFTRFKNHAMAKWNIPKPQPRFETLNPCGPEAHEWSDGGETAGLARLDDYVRHTRAVLHYHETRNGMIERDDSSKFSRWLAWGALSPRQIHRELIQLDAEVGPADGITGLIYELVWRDYFKFLAFVMQESFFSLQGLRPAPLNVWNNERAFVSWCNGETGNDFVDANMRELLHTGWMSNRGRQNVASYLAKEIQLDWRLGAKWFEDQLIDEDPENNFGNWQYLAGVGTDPRDRKFDTHRQASHYDPEGRYRERWLK